METDDEFGVYDDDSDDTDGTLDFDEILEVDVGKETQQYRIDHTSEGDCLVCLICGKASYNQKDIEHKYCGHCHEFLT
jgi:hypothetical protein